MDNDTLNKSPAVHEDSGTFDGPSKGNFVRQDIELGAGDVDIERIEKVYR